MVAADSNVACGHRRCMCNLKPISTAQCALILKVVYKAEYKSMYVINLLPNAIIQEKLFLFGHDNKASNATHFYGAQ